MKWEVSIACTSSTITWTSRTGADAADGIVSLRDVYANSRARGHTVTRNPMLATLR